MSLSIAPYVGSPPSVVRQMLTLAEVKPANVVYDLGCGDGRVVIMAAQEFGARGVGVELRNDLANKASETVFELGLKDMVKIVHSTIFKVDLSSADVVTLYLTTDANRKVKPKLESELKHGSRVVSHDYEVPGWTPFKTNKFYENQKLGYPSHTIYVYQR